MRCSSAPTVAPRSGRRRRERTARTGTRRSAHRRTARARCAAARHGAKDRLAPRFIDHRLESARGRSGRAAHGAHSRTAASRSPRCRAACATPTRVRAAPFSQSPVRVSPHIESTSSSVETTWPARSSKIVSRRRCCGRRGVTSWPLATNRERTEEVEVHLRVGADHVRRGADVSDASANRLASFDARRQSENWEVDDARTNSVGSRWCCGHGCPGDGPGDHDHDRWPPKRAMTSCSSPSARSAA